MRYAEETLAKAALALDENGYTAMAGIETMGKMNQLGTLDEVIRLCHVSTRHFRPVVDFGHINARTQGGLSSADDFKRIFDTIAEKLSPEHADSLHCHFSKIEYTAMGEKSTSPLTIPSTARPMSALSKQSYLSAYIRL